MIVHSFQYLEEHVVFRMDGGNLPAAVLPYIYSPFPPPQATKSLGLNAASSKNSHVSAPGGGWGRALPNGKRNRNTRSTKRTQKAQKGPHTPHFLCFLCSDLCFLCSVPVSSGKALGPA